MVTPEFVKKMMESRVTGHAVVRDGFLPGGIPGFRVIGVRMDGNGKANLNISSQLFVLDEAMALLEDKIRDNLGL